MTEVLTLAPLEDLLLGTNAEEIAEALAGRSEECFTTRVVTFGQYVHPEFFTLIFRNRELFNRFSQFTEEGKISFAKGIADLIDGSRPHKDTMNTRVEVEFQWSSTKRRRLRVSKGHRHITFDRYLRNDILLHIDLI